MDNLALNEEFEIEVVKNFTVGQLITFIDILDEAIADIAVLKETAVLSQKDRKAVEYQEYLHNAKHNRKVMEDVLTVKEHSLTMPEATIADVYLN